LLYSPSFRKQNHAFKRFFPLECPLWNLLFQTQALLNQLSFNDLDQIPDVFSMELLNEISNGLFSILSFDQIDFILGKSQKIPKSQLYSLYELYKQFKQDQDTNHLHQLIQSKSVDPKILLLKSKCCLLLKDDHSI
jgi:hypothetical protein